MREFNICDIVVVKVDHPIGRANVNTKGELGVISEIGRTGSQHCYRVQHASRNRKEGFFYAAYEIRKATEREIRDELIKLMLVDWEIYSN